MTKLGHRVIAIVCGLVVMVASAAAQEIKPAVIYAVGQKFDKSFNESTYHATLRFTAETGIPVREFQPINPTEFPRAVNALFRRGATDIVAVGFYYATPLDQIAARYPSVRFTLVDAVADQPNVRSVTFREHEGMFLIGMLAALKSATGTVGFIGALDIPLLRRFIAGYRQGAVYAVPGIEVAVSFVGTTPAAFNDPAAGAEVALSQFERGVDVVFAGAGSSNFGVFQTAEERGRYAIGVDGNQNPLHPGTILTSMLKRVDVAVLESFDDARAGQWTAGVRSFGLAENGVDYAMDENNAAQVTEAMRERVEEARREIIDGSLVVRTQLD